MEGVSQLPKILLGKLSLLSNGRKPCTQRSEHVQTRETQNRAQIPIFSSVITMTGYKDCTGEIKIGERKFSDKYIKNPVK